MSDRARIVVVTGGRKYANRKAVFRALDEASPQALYVGDAQGADRNARNWGVCHGYALNVFKAQWVRYGAAAGPIRNGEMLRAALARAEACGSAPLLLAFPGGRGTADCVRQATAMGIEVRHVL